MSPRRCDASSIGQRLDERWDELKTLLELERVIDGRRANAVELREWKAHLQQRAEDIASYSPNLVPSGKLARQLDRVARLSHLLMVELDKLEPSLRQQLVTDAVRRELMQLPTKSRSLAPMQVSRGASGSRRWPSAGGSPQKKLDRARKKLAADIAFELLIRYRDLFPTGTLAGPWIQLTEILVWVATGRDNTGDVSRACSAYLKELEAVPGIRESRRWLISEMRATRGEED